MAGKKVELSVNQKKAYAEALYLAGDLTQKEIAIRVGISENTMSNWVSKEGWDVKRRSLLSSKTNILARLYRLLEKQVTNCELEENIGDAKLSDAMSKTTAAIRQMETDTSIAEITEVGKLFINFMLEIDQKRAVDFMEHWDLFVKQRLKNL